MAVRQELLYYVRGSPVFNVEAEYTDIPKILRGYYKEVSGVVTENLERSKSDKIRAGNVWVDIQQVFYRMEENVNRCYTMDIEPVFCEITIRRLERFRTTGKTGWQNSNPFAAEIDEDNELRRLL